MSLTPSISVSQSALVPSTFTVTDDSTGSDPAITQRRITIQDGNGNYLTGNGTVNYDLWPLADLAITFSFLTGDIGANIFVEWLDVNDVMINIYNNNYSFPEYGKQFFYYLIQLLGLTPGTYQDSNYGGNLALFWANIVAGINAVTYGNDISAAQSCFNRTNEMRLNESKYF